MELTETERNTKHIICFRWHMKHINDYEHIKSDLGYTILNERYNTCKKRMTYNAEKLH